MIYHWTCQPKAFTRFASPTTNRCTSITSQTTRRISSGIFQPRSAAVWMTFPAIRMSLQMPSRCMTRHFERLDLARKRSILNAGRSKAVWTGEHGHGRLFGLTHHSAKSNVATNIFRRFRSLVLKHFPKASKLNKIFNPNTLKVSYSCLPNMAAVIRQHNSTIVNSQTSAPDNAGSASKCNCRVKANCPMNGECMVQSVVYRATVRSQDTEKDYTGLTALTFKQRFNSHQHSMRHRKYGHSTALSNYVWSLKDQDIAFDIKWIVLRKAAAHRNTTIRCNFVHCGETGNYEGGQGPVFEQEIRTCLYMPAWEPVLPLQFPSRDSMTVAFPSVSRFWFHRFLHWVFASCLVVLPSVARFWFQLSSLGICLLSLS